MQSVDQVRLERIVSDELPQLGRRRDVTRQSERQALHAVLIRYAFQMKVVPLRGDPAHPGTARQRALVLSFLLRRAPIRLLHYDPSRRNSFYPYASPNRNSASPRSLYVRNKISAARARPNLSIVSVRATIPRKSACELQIAAKPVSKRSELSNFQICQIRFSNRGCTSFSGSPTCPLEFVESPEIGERCDWLPIEERSVIL